MHLHGFAETKLEVRRRKGGGLHLAGKFPYGKLAVLSSGGRTGRPQKESIEPHAFRYRVEQVDADIHLLVGHDFNRPMANKLGQTLRMNDTESALEFEADISDQMMEVGYVREAMLQFGAGLVGGISPGFTIPPKRTVENAVTYEDEGHDPERGMHNAQIRRVHEAILYELSLVTVPAYDETQLTMRGWKPERDQAIAPKPFGNDIHRWR